MSGTAKVKPPNTNAEWARNVQKRLDQVEHPASARIGAWVLSTDSETGALIASNVNGGSTVIAAAPSGQTEADEILTSDFPHIKLERQAVQSADRGSVQLVQWDTLTHASPEWGVDTPTTSFVVPVGGTFLCCYHLAFEDDSEEVNKALFMVDGTPRMAQEYDPQGDQWFQSMYMAETFDLAAGQLISCGAYVSGIGSFDFGPTTPDPQVFTSLSLTRLPVG